VLKAYLEKLLARQSLRPDEAEALCTELIGSDQPALVAGVLVALRAKGETPDEVAGFARAMQRMARRPALDDAPTKAATGAPTIDIVGTGGDQAHSYNISTAAALLCAAIGLRVVKHGNRSVSSLSGSADVLAKLGLPMPLNEQQAGVCLRETGFTFLFAPHYHSATASVAGVRKALGVRTIFNMLGPLTNPARPPFGLLGAYSPDAARTMARALSALPISRYFVVHSEVDGQTWDEATPAGPFHILNVTPHEVNELIVDPRMLGLDRCTGADLRGGDAAHNADALRRVFAGERGAHRDSVVLSVALALQVCGFVEDLRHGIDRAASTIDSGPAKAWLARLAEVGQRLAGEEGAGR
jgi:anthranilate phosphoribosyltransferase